MSKNPILISVNGKNSPESNGAFLRLPESQASLQRVRIIGPAVRNVIIAEENTVFDEVVKTTKQIARNVADSLIRQKPVEQAPLVATDSIHDSAGGRVGNSNPLIKTQQSMAVTTVDQSADVAIEYSNTATEQPLSETDKIRSMINNIHNSGPVDDRLKSLTEV